MKRRNVWLTFGLVLVLSGLAGVVDWPKGPNIHIGTYKRDLNVRLGLDLRGGTSLVYTADMSKVPAGDRQSALDGVRDVVERRVNGFGVSEPVVQTSRVGSQYRISVDLAGITDINQAIKLIGETPLLEFREQQGPSGIPDAEAKKKAQDLIKQIAKPGANFAALAKTNSDDPSAKVNGGDLGFAPRGQFVAEFDKALFDQLKNGQVSPEPIKTQFGYHVLKRIEDKTVTENGKQVLQVHGEHILIATTDTASQLAQYVPTALSGKQLKRADVVFDPNSGAPQVQLQFNGEGTKLFGDLTKKNLGKILGIYLDGQAISLPRVQSEITSGTAVITGNFTLDQAKQLAKRLNAGALPVPITLVSQANVGATLGKESIERSLVAGIIGLILVALFMILNYRFPGFLAVVALLIYSLIVLAIFKLWPVTLTLAGIAGYILSIGIAVDANILVFERTREELRQGLSLVAAIEHGFQRAWLSIRDSNVSSLITAFILIWFGSSLIKGFAVTLAIGIGVSLFSAITVTRTLMRLTVTPWMAKHLWLFGRHLQPPPQTHV